MISINGTIGSLALYENEKIILGKSACFINLGDTVNKMFVYHAMQIQSTINFFISELTGTTIKNLSLATIKKCVFNFPSLPEQTKIANFLSAIDEKINHCSKQIERMEDWKKGLLQQMFV